MSESAFLRSSDGASWTAAITSSKDSRVCFLSSHQFGRREALSVHSHAGDDASRSCPSANGLITPCTWSKPRIAPAARRSRSETTARGPSASIIAEMFLVASLCCSIYSSISSISVICRNNLFSLYFRYPAKNIFFHFGNHKSINCSWKSPGKLPEQVMNGRRSENE